MNQQKPEDNINELADAATTSIREQKEKSAALATAQPKRSMLRQIAMTVLLLAFAGIAVVQYPRFHEPFGRPDANQDPMVAEADLSVIATMIQSYRISQGSYPATLDQVRLPETLAAFVAEQKIAYHQTDKAYALDWSLPRWHAVFDGETGKVEVTPVNGAK